MVGQSLGHYRIVQLLGKGGMGEVYVAEDTKLNRQVALKVLPSELAGNAERRTRFEREAQAVAALNHPNIVTIHSVEEVDGQHFITMELVKGKSLSELIPNAGLSTDRFLELAIPLSDAVAAAHEHGVTHRDLKPENIMVGDDGRLRILDFGLAKLAEGPISSSGSGSDDMPTQTVTQEGRVLGTVAYMSPEQAEGKPIDHRTDIFSLGVIFYEMATGKRPFEGDTSMSVLTSIMRDDPGSVTDLNGRLPRQLGRFVKRCLQKDPTRRYQSALDLRNELEELQEEVATGQVAPVGTAIAGGSKGPGWLLPAALVLAAIGVGFGIWSWLGRDRGAPAATRAESMFESMEIRPVTSTGTARLSAISPDGKYVAYVAGDNPEGVLRVKQIATGSDVDIFRPAGAGLWFHQVMFAADGDYVLYVAGTNFDRAGDLWQIPTLGGTPRRLLGGINWSAKVGLSPEGERLAMARAPKEMTGPAHELWIGDLAGGDPQRVLSLPESQMLSSIAWSPDGEQIAIATFDFQGARSGVSLVPLAGSEPALLGERRWTGINQIAWYPDGSGLVVVAFEIGLPGNQVWELKYPSGDTRRITNDLNDYDGISLTADGQIMALVQTDRRSSLWLAALPDGDATQLATTTGNENGIDGVAFLPGGELLFTAESGTARHLWAVQADGTGSRQITTEGLFNGDPYVGGSEPLITYTRFDGETVGVFTANPDGSDRRSLTPEEPIALNRGLSPDGTWVYYQTLRDGAMLMYRRPVAGGPAELVLDGHAHSPSWSHDGSRMAVHRNDAADGRWKTYIYATDDDELLSVLDFHSEGGSPWGPDDASLYHLETVDGVQNLFLMPLDGSTRRQVTHFTEGEIFNFAVSPDGATLVVAHGRTLRDIVRIENFR
jgi:Tol biopolymer transport system component/predicted Ser/Thr protein kinase